MTAKPTKTTKNHTTTERYIHAVRDAIIEWAKAEGQLTDEQLAKLAATKLLYGIGDGTYRGVCHYEAWATNGTKVDVVEIAANAQESWVQLAGTTLHELGHVLAGWGSGHGAEWKEATLSLGFTRKPAAAGQSYHLAMFVPTLRHAIYRLAAAINDGTPAFRTYGHGGLAGLFGGVTIKPCSAGTGTKGGTSRGKGSGSRLRLWECECAKPVKVRVASDDFKAHCDACGSAFTRKG